jgi:hypothetical protein
MAILLLVASAMLAEAYKSYKDDKYCDGSDILGVIKVQTDFQCKHLLTGVVSATILIGEVQI